VLYPENMSRRGVRGGEWGPSTWVVPLVCVGAYIFVGQTLATHGIFEAAFDNCVFEADGPRIVENSTTLRGPQWRTRIHPLHGLLTVPLGSLFELLLSSPAHAASLVVSVLAGLTLVFTSVLFKRAGLGALDRNLFVALLGASATMVTFGAVPEVHILSGLGLTLVALSFFPRSDRAEVGTASDARPSWLRALPGMFVAVGAQLTSLALVPLGFLLHLPGGPWRRRIWRAALLSAAFAVSVVVLHGVQRAFRTEPARAVAEAEVPAGVGDAAAPPMGAVDSHLLFVTKPSQLASRAVETAVAVAGVGLVAPELSVGTRNGQPNLGFRYWPPNFRPLGAVALGLWLLLAGSSTALAVRGKGAMALVSEEPGAVFAALSVFFYGVVFWLYGDELFLFSPNWVSPLIVIVGVLYSRTHLSSARLTSALRALLTATVVFTGANTYLHLRDVLQIYT
jgi:hypothetical protein